MSDSSAPTATPAATVAAAADTTAAAKKPEVELAPQQKQNPKYYYWHGSLKERAAVGDVAPTATPQLLKSDPIDASLASPTGSPHLKTATITKYSWCNNEKSVSVYVDFSGVAEISQREGGVTINFSKRHLDVTIVGADGRLNKLHLRLSKEVDAAASSFRYKPDQLILKLIKPEGKTETWFDLVDTKLSGDSDSD